jgi:hypothetical protein
MTRNASDAWCGTLLFSAFLLVGCGGAYSDPDSQIPFFTETFVHLGGTGAPEIVVNRVPVAFEMDSAGGATVARPNALAACLQHYHYPATFLYDNAGNSACLDGGGTFDLTTFPRGQGSNWGAATKAYTPGAWSGYFEAWPYYGGTLHHCTQGFTDTRQLEQALAGSCAEASTSLTQTTRTYLP